MRLDTTYPSAFSSSAVREVCYFANAATLHRSYGVLTK
jgi:hypothetical protein